jgi:hypothetical protein
MCTLPCPWMEHIVHTSHFFLDIISWLRGCCPHSLLPEPLKSPLVSVSVSLSPSLSRVCIMGCECLCGYMYVCMYVCMLWCVYASTHMSYTHLISREGKRGMAEYKLLTPFPASVPLRCPTRYSAGRSFYNGHVFILVSTCERAQGQCQVSHSTDVSTLVFEIGSLPGWPGACQCG